MLNKNTIDILIPPGREKNVTIDLLIQNLALMRTLTQFLLNDYCERYQLDPQEVLNKFNEDFKKNNYDILASLSIKHGK